jgi:predicted DNA-binding transcriptional regulator YafY
MRWGVEKRLEFIEFRLFWEGGVNRSDIIETFGVSVPQASKDLALYQEKAAGNVIYDKSAKTYIPSETFSPKFLNPQPDAYLSRLRSVAEGLIDYEQSWIASLPESDIALPPKRDIDVDVLRAILGVVKERRSVEILYQSMNEDRPDPIWRRISPHAFGYDGLRWHTRAFCHLEEKFKDFLLPRILRARNIDESGAKGEQDLLWHRYFEVKLAPHPKLTESQKKVVAKDYGFTDGYGTITVRYAMLFYAMKRLGLLHDPEKEDPRRQHIIAANRKEMLAALEESSAIGSRDREVGYG